MESEFDHDGEDPIKKLSGLFSEAVDADNAERQQNAFDLERKRVREANKVRERRQKDQKDARHLASYQPNFAPFPISDPALTGVASPPFDQVVELKVPLALLDEAWAELIWGSKNGIGTLRDACRQHELVLVNCDKNPTPIHPAYGVGKLNYPVPCPVVSLVFHSPKFLADCGSEITTRTLLVNPAKPTFTEISFATGVTSNPRGCLCSLDFYRNKGIPTCQ